MPAKRFQGPSHRLLGSSGAQVEGQGSEADGLGVFARPPRATFEDVVEHLQRAQDEAAINALMDKVEAQRAQPEAGTSGSNDAAPVMTTSDRKRIATEAVQPAQKWEAYGVIAPSNLRVLCIMGCLSMSRAVTNGLQDALKLLQQHMPGESPTRSLHADLQGNDVIDLCESDAEDAGPNQPLSKRSCSAAERSAAMASTSGRPAPQRRYALSQSDKFSLQTRSFCCMHMHT